MEKMKLDVLNWKNEVVATVDAPEELFKAPLKQHLLHGMVRWQRACRRRGTHKAKTKAEVRGGGAKPFNQKGTGRARQGSSRSPLLEGGGVIFPPQPRDYSYKVNKKEKRQAIRVALSYLYKNGNVKIVEDMDMKEAKTKALSGILKGFKVDKSLLIDAAIKDKFSRACRNLPNYRYGDTDLVNVYELLKYNHIVLTKGSLEKIYERCGVN